MEEQLQTVKRQRLQPAALPTSELSKYLMRTGVDHLDKALNEATSAMPSHADVNEQVAVLAAFTGIEFEHVTNLLLPISSPITRRYTFRGRVHGLSFGLRVDVKEEGFEILQVSPSLLSDLTVLLAPFLETVRKERALRLFFKGFAKYACASAERKTAFGAIKFGQSVHLPFGAMSHRLLFDGARQAGFSFTVDWRLTLDFAGNVAHYISLFPRYSPELSAADRKGQVLMNVPEQFRMLVAQRGVQAAVEVIASLARAEQ